MRYRKKPVVIEARQLTPDEDWFAVYQWIESNTLGSFEPLAVLEGKSPTPASGVSIDPSDGALLIATLEGLMKAEAFDWIIRGVAGEFYPCRPDVFAATYEPAEDA